MSTALTGNLATPTAAPQTGPITVTERAAAEVKRIIEEQRATGVVHDERVFLRLSVKGGGCSGFQHKLDLDHHYNEKADEMMEYHGVPVVIDRKSLLYVSGAQIDFHNEINRRGFSVTNPNARTTCGCGSSFSV
jgi:iron-sulfur cluster insertion protein